MSENLNRGIRDFSEFDTMETEELKEILRLDADAPEGTESDTELLLYVMEVLASRRNNTNITGNNAQRAWESFQENYMPAECLENAPRKERKHTAAPWMRRLTAAAAVLVLVVLIPVSVKALSLEKLLDVVARWARETFSFVSGEDTEVSEPDKVNAEGYSSLQDALTKSNRDPNMVPTWVPDGFEIESIEKDISPIQETYSVIYLNGDKKLLIQVRTHIPSDIQNAEIAGDPIETYPVSEINYYIFENDTQLCAIWTIESYECFISGDLTIDEIKTMIDSIQKG